MAAALLEDSAVAPTARRLARTPERRLSSSQACRGLSTSPQPAPKMAMSPLSTSSHLAEMFARLDAVRGALVQLERLLVLPGEKGKLPEQIERPRVLPLPREHALAQRDRGGKVVREIRAVGLLQLGVAHRPGVVAETGDGDEPTTGMGRRGSLIASTPRSNQSFTAWLVPHTSGPVSAMPSSRNGQCAPKGTPAETVPHRNAQIGGNQVIGFNSSITSRGRGSGTGA